MVAQSSESELKIENLRCSFQAVGEAEEHQAVVGEGLNCQRYDLQQMPEKTPTWYMVVAGMTAPCPESERDEVQGHDRAGAKIVHLVKVALGFR